MNSDILRSDQHNDFFLLHMLAMFEYVICLVSFLRI
jgi:hypothetical protein